jgi:hypothetical protein
MAQLFFNCNREITARQRKTAGEVAFLEESPKMLTTVALEDCQIPEADVSEAQASNIRA